MNIFKDKFVSYRGFILITIFAIIIGTSVFLYYYKKQEQLDTEFEKSRAGIQDFINNIKNTNNLENNN